MDEDQDMIEVDQEDQAMDTSESPEEQQWKGVIEALQGDHVHNRVHVMTKHVSTLITSQVDKLLKSIIVDMVMEKFIRVMQTLMERLGCPTRRMEAPVIDRLITMAGLQFMEGIPAGFEQQSTLTVERVIPALMEAFRAKNESRSQPSIE